MRNARIVAAAALGLLVATSLLEAGGTGVSGYSGNPSTNGGQGCGACHSGGIEPAVSIDGPRSLLRGETGLYTLRISTGPFRFGGLDVSATSGAIAPLEPLTWLQGGEVTHIAPKPADGRGEVTFTFQWTAPSVAGTATLHGAGLSSDGFLVTGDAGAVVTLDVAIEGPAPQNEAPLCIPGGPYAGIAGQAVVVDGSASRDPDGTIVGHAWDFGDGEGWHGALTSHIWASAGTYRVVLTVTDDDGATATAETVAEVAPPPLSEPPVAEPPVASAGGPYEAEVGVPIELDGSASIDPDGLLVSWQWDFGDGESGVGDRPSHAWAQPGTYTVTLMVTDADGLSDSAMATVEVHALPVQLHVSVVAPACVQVPRGHTRRVPMAVVIDVREVASGTTVRGTAVVLKDGVPVAERAFSAVVPEASRRDPRRACGRDHPGRLDRVVVRFRPAVASSDAPEVVWSARIEAAEGDVESPPVSTVIRVPRCRLGPR